MASLLPSEDHNPKSVKDFGLGPYDSTSDGDSGTDFEDPSVDSLPSDLSDVPDPEYYIGYPPSSPVRGASAILPGDPDRPPRGPRPQDLIMNLLSPPPSDESDVGSSSLPGDDGNPASRADYYDRMTMGGQPLSDIWADEDSGAYALEESLPSVHKNETTMDDLLGALGNSEGGYVVEDQSGPFGFPTDRLTEEADYIYDGDGDMDLDDGGKLLPFGYGVSVRTMSGHNRQATNIELVGQLTQEFLKEQGRKGIVRRHVLAFLQDRGLPQFLASDIIRCLKHRHKITIPDVMDTFPLAREASSSKDLRAVRASLIELEIEHVADPEVASVFRRCAANVSKVLAALERLGG